MEDVFLNISKPIWETIFLVLRWGPAALILAYLMNVLVKKNENLSDIKGEIYERRIDSYKVIHHWAMQLQKIISPPAYLEKIYADVLHRLHFKISMQGMEYPSFFDSPQKLVSFSIETKKLVGGAALHLDYVLEQKLSEFVIWLDDIINLMNIFIQIEADPFWKYDKTTQETHAKLACHLMGIAFLVDINRFFRQIDRLLRLRLQEIRLSSISSDTWPIRLKHKLVDYCESKMGDGQENKYQQFLCWVYMHVLFRSYGCSQISQHKPDVLTLMIRAHYSSQYNTEQFYTLEEKKMRQLFLDFHESMLRHYTS